MPEGPECHVIASRLNRILRDKQLVGFEIHGGRYKKHGAPTGLADFEEGGKNIIINGVHVKGKLLYWTFSNGFVLLNTLGMSGNWRIKKSKHCDVSICYLDGETHRTLWFKDQRHFGTLKFIKRENLDKKLGSIGPDVLSNDCTKQKWDALSAKYGHWTLPKLLMNQNKISGIGNYLKCEILYSAKASPLKKISEFSNETLDLVFRFLREIPRASLKAKGVSIRNYSLPDGSDGSYQFKLQVYHRRRDPLGNVVIRIVTDDKRTTHWVREVQE